MTKVWVRPCEFLTVSQVLSLYHSQLGRFFYEVGLWFLFEIKVIKPPKQFLELSILPKNERKTWKNHPESSQDNFFWCFLRFLEELRIPFFFEIYWSLEELYIYSFTMSNYICMLATHLRAVALTNTADFSKRSLILNKMKFSGIKKFLNAALNNFADFSKRSY